MGRLLPDRSIALLEIGLEIENKEPNMMRAAANE